MIRRFVSFASLICFMAGFVAAAEAQGRRRLYVEPKPRSWLEGGHIETGGSMYSHVRDTRLTSDKAQYGARSGDSGMLPSKNGQATMTFMSPNFFSKGLD